MGKIKKDKKFGQWYPDAWDKDKDPGAVDRCGSKTALGAAQK